jgi:hypothetical protein
MTIVAEGVIARARSRRIERMRTAAATGLERAIADARRPGGARFSCVVPVCRDEVLMAEPFLLALIRRLRDGLPVRPVGVAHIHAVLTDGASPLYLDTHPGTLRAWARVTLAELDDGPE